jgi:hypothetical protein
MGKTLGGLAAPTWPGRNGMGHNTSETPVAKGGSVGSKASASKGYAPKPASPIPLNWR